MTLETFIQQQYSEKSVPRYMRQIEQFMAYKGEKNSLSNYNDILEYIGTLREKGLHAKSLKNHLFSLKIYFRYLVSIGERTDHPCEKLQLKDQINRSILVESLYTKEELENLYKGFKSREPKRKNLEQSLITNKRDKVILSLLIYQALTTTEIIELSVKSIDLEEGTINIDQAESIGRRGNKSRILSLKSNQILLFDSYIKEVRKTLSSRQKPNDQQDYFVLNDQGLQLWGSYLNRMLNNGSETEKKYTPMKIRQSVIAHLLKEKNDIRIVQEFAGHRRAGSTEAYKRTGFEELQRNIELLHPRQ